MIRRPPGSTRTATLFPYTTLFRSTFSIAAVGSQPEAARFGQEIHLFSIEDEVRPAPECATLFVGSSSIRFWFGIDRDFPGRKIIKRGLGGATIADFTYLFDAVVGRYKPRHIVRSEERRVGEEWVSTGRSRWSPSPKKKK